MADDDLKAELERLRNENAALKKGADTGITMKVSEKGALSIYGMGRFPVTLYKEQWLKLLGMSDDIGRLLWRTRAVEDEGLSALRKAKILPRERGRGHGTAKALQVLGQKRHPLTEPRRDNDPPLQCPCRVIRIDTRPLLGGRRSTAERDGEPRIPTFPREPLKASGRGKDAPARLPTGQRVRIQRQAQG